MSNSRLFESVGRFEGRLLAESRMCQKNKLLGCWLCIDK